MTAVILARGLGRRMRDGGRAGELTSAQAEAAAAGQKAMMPIERGATRRPFLDYILDSLRAAGCTRVCLVVSPDHDDIRRRYLLDLPASHLEIVVVEQREPLGTADAVLAAEAVVAGTPFLVANGDNLYPVAALGGLVALDGPGLPAFPRADLLQSSNFTADRIASFALVEGDDDGCLLRIVEKPTVEEARLHHADVLVSMNAWRFDDRIFDACRDVMRSRRGEFELPEAVGLALARGVVFRIFTAAGPVLDLSRPDDVPQVSRRLADIEPFW